VPDWVEIKRAAGWVRCSGEAFSGSSVLRSRLKLFRDQRRRGPRRCRRRNVCSGRAARTRSLSEVAPPGILEEREGGATPIVHTVGKVSMSPMDFR